MRLYDSYYHIIYGPRGILNNNSPGIVEVKCSKCYTRELVAQTITGNEGYLSTVSSLFDCGQWKINNCQSGSTGH